MNARLERLFAWSGIASIGVIGIGFALVAGFLPPPSPGDDAETVANFFRENQDSIRWGMVIMAVGALLLAMFVVGMTLQIRRIEGAHSGLAYLTLAMGAVLVLQFLYMDFFWQAAAFRADRSPEVIQGINDLAWIPFIGAGGPLLVMDLCFAIAILSDKRERPAFPRWLGYFGLWCAVGNPLGWFVVFFTTGPLAWDGILAFWVPVGLFGAWMIVNSIYMVKAVDIAEEEEEKLVAASVNGSDGAAMAKEISALKEQLEQLNARVGDRG